MTDTDIAWLGGLSGNLYSQFGEDGILDAIFKIIGIENRWCFECGAADGLFFSNTRALIESGWTGVLVESCEFEFARLLSNAENCGGRCIPMHARLDKDFGIDQALERAKAPPEIDLISIDVDGQDYYLFNAIVRCRPRVVVIEYDPNADEQFIPRLGGSGQAGIGAIRRLFWGKHYEPVFRTATNLIAIRRPLNRLLLSVEK